MGLRHVEKSAAATSGFNILLSAAASNGDTEGAEGVLMRVLAQKQRGKTLLLDVFEAVC